jgi:phosphate transport system substrate-binding protein
MGVKQPGFFVMGVLPPLAVLLSACGSTGPKASSTIQISGSSTVFPVIERAVAAYRRTDRGKRVNVELSEVGTSAGLRKFCAGTIPMANASRPISSKELKACEDKAITFIELPVAFDALTVVVSRDNTWAQEITTQELARAWGRQAQGKIRSWRQVNLNWPDRPMQLCAPGADSGSFDYFNEAINGDKANARTDVESSEDDNVLVNCVARNPNALGYFGFGYYQANAEKLKALAISREGEQPVLPSMQTVQEGRYKPLSRPLFIYVNDKQMRANDEIRNFVGFTVSNGLRFVAEAGSIPLPADTYRLVEAKLYRHILGTSFGGDLPVGLSFSEALRRSFDDTRKPEFR